MLPALISPDQPRTPVFTDGLGDRFLFAESATGAHLQVLRLRSEMADVPAFEFALRERAARLANFRSEAHARVYRVLRTRGPARELSVVSEHVEGIRLSALLGVAEQHQVPIELSTALSLTRQLLQATTLFQGYAAMANGLLAPERLIVTPRARLTVVEQVLCVAIEQLRYSRERLWRELRIATCTNPDPARFSARSDVISIGLVALALVLGRRLRDEEFPDGLPALLDAARERSALGYERPLSPLLRDWLSSALQLDPHRSFATVPDASRAFEEMVNGDPLYLSVPSAIERFLYGCTAALIQPPVFGQPAPPVALQPAQAVPEPRTTPAPVMLDVAPVPVGEPEIVVQMLPPPGETDVTTVSGSDVIDWAAISRGPEVVLTADDIAQLFVAPEAVPAARVALACPDSVSTPAAVSPDPEPAALESVPDAEPAAALPDIPPVAVFQASSFSLPETSNWALKWKRVAAAAVLVGVLAGATVLSRLVRPALAAASEMGTLVIDTDPRGLPVLIGGIEQGHTPARLSVTSGEHLIEVRGPGATRVVPITVPGGAEVAHYIEFGREISPSPLPAAAPAASVVQETTPRWGWLEVRAASSLEIRAGGRVLGRTGGERVRLGEGQQEIELVNSETGERVRRVAHIVPGKVTMLTIAGQATGVVHLNAAPWAEVWIGGRRVGETPLANVSVPVGRHEVVFRHPELGEKREAISVTAAVPVRLSMDMR
jgi:hypothetical protein